MHGQQNVKKLFFLFVTLKLNDAVRMEVGPFRIQFFLQFTFSEIS